MGGPCPRCGLPLDAGWRLCPRCGLDLGRWPPEPHPFGLDWPGVVALVGGIIVAAGTILPWASALSILGTVDVNGFSSGGDGPIALGCAAAIAFGGVALLARVPRGLGATFVIGGAAVAAFVAAGTIVNANRETGDVAGGLVHTSLGPGLYVILVGAAVAVVGLGLPDGRPNAPAPREVPWAGGSRQHTNNDEVRLALMLMAIAAIVVIGVIVAINNGYAELFRHSLP